MRLIFIGPPGSGKGTQAKLLSQHSNLVHFATGDILREAMRLETPEGKLAAPYIINGQLVPDNLVNDIVVSRFRAPNRPANFVMDGYPRTIGQAIAFDSLLHELGLALDGVIFLKVADQEIIKRLSSRWNCPNTQCKASYNTETKPPRNPRHCDDCGSVLQQRDDDREETVARRLRIFHEVYDDLVNYYRGKGQLIEVPGLGSVEGIQDKIQRALAARNIK